MSDQEKIWFIYLTDHHEGPFTVAEVAEKAKAGLVGGQSLAWKDGMPEWVAAETIPELSAALGAASAASASLELAEVSPAAPVPAEEPGEVSLAQLLAASQAKEEPSDPSMATASGQITNAASVFSSLVSAVHRDNPVTIGTGLSIGAGLSVPGSTPGAFTAASVARAGRMEPEPAPDEEVWTLRIGLQVSGLHSLQRLQDLAGSGDIPADAFLWRPGWDDFRAVSAVAEVDGARRAPRAGRTNTRISSPAQTAFTAAPAGATGPGSDDTTDTGLARSSAGNLGGLLERARQLFGDGARPAAKTGGARQAAPLAAGKTGLTRGTPVRRPSAATGSLGRVAGALGALLGFAALAGGAYYFFLASPLPSDLDVGEDEREMMAEAVKRKPSEGHKLFLAQARGTEENPANPSSPKYYVASNLPEGSTVTLTVTGVPGTLVNRLAFEKTFTAGVERSHLAVFDQVKDDGKPLWGEFMLKAGAEGADPVEEKRFIGLKGGAYKSRLNAFKESVQGDYDKEIGELREYIATLKNLQAEATRQVAEYKRDWAVPASHAKILSEWGGFLKSSQALLGQLDASLSARRSGDRQPKHHARAFQDVATTVGQVGQLIRMHGERLSGATPGGNVDETEGFVQAGVLGLEAWLAQAVAKNPFEAAHVSEGAKPPSPAASPPSAQVPAVSSSPGEQ